MININSLTLEQLLELNLEVVSLIKRRRKIEAGSKRRALSLGDRVTFPDRGGFTITGTVTKIMRTRAIVEQRDTGPHGRTTRWKCHLTSLTLCD